MIWMSRIPWQRTLRDVALATIVAMLTVSAAFGQGAVPVGGEFQINSYTHYGQYSPAATTLDDGSFVVLWESLGSSGSDIGASIQGQRFTAEGMPVGGQWQVNTEATGIQADASVEALADGGFVALWFTGRPDFSTSVQGQRYAADGTMLGGEFLVNSWTEGHRSQPSAAASDDGGFVVVWRNSGPNDEDHSGGGILGRRFGPEGNAEGLEFQINAFTVGDQSSPVVAALADDRYVVLWHSLGSSGSDVSIYSVQGQLFAADDTATGEQFQVNSYTTDSQLFPSVAALADGGFVALWESFGSSGSDSDGPSIQGQRYAPDGTTRGGQFQVNSHTTTFQVGPSVVGLESGGFIATWTSSVGTGIQGQRYGSDGLVLEGEFQVQSYALRSQFNPSVTALAEDGFVVAWESDGSSGSDQSDFSIQGQRFAAPRHALVGLDGKCLDVEADNPAAGTPVNIYRCHGGENQRWRLDLTSAPQRIVGLGDKCLIPGPDNRMVIGECGSLGDLWQLVTTGPSSPSALVNVATGLCLDVEGAVPADGTPTRLFTCHGGANQIWRPAAEVCTRDSLGLCLEAERFRVDLAWRSFDSTSGSGQAVPVGSDDSGLLWFFENDNWEMLIKVLDGCAINDRFWVFAGATTTVEYTLTVTDTALGTVREYFNPLGHAADAITDTDAFDACSASTASAPRPPTVEKAKSIRSGVQSEPSLKGTCMPSPTRMCLSEGRFSVEVTWGDYAGTTGPGQVVGSGSPDSGLFWFFNATNWELLIKVLDACHLEDPHFLMLAAATTDVEYTLRVTDTQTGVFREYFNSLGNAAPALVDGFETCP